MYHVVTLLIYISVRLAIVTDRVVENTQNCKQTIAKQEMSMYPKPYYPMLVHDFECLFQPARMIGEV
jgi:hypothetical protein